MSRKTKEELMAALDRERPDLLRVDQAPTHEQLMHAAKTRPDLEEARKRHRAEAAVLDEEWFRDYKAADAEGNVWLVQNPALIVAQAYRGITPIRRREPRRADLFSTGSNLPARRREEADDTYF